MAEFCLNCLNKLDGTSLPEKDVVFSKNPERCEECRQIKPVVIKYKQGAVLRNALRKLWRPS